MNKLKDFRDRLWYRIELFIGKGSMSMFYALGIVLMFTILFLLGIRYILEWLLPETSMPAEDLTSNFYHLLMEVTDPGNMATFLKDPFWVKVTAIFAGFCGIVIFSLLIAVINASVEKMLYTFSQGTTRLFENKHYLIIGFNSRLPDIIKEFAIASKNEKHTVVILSEMPKELVDEKIDLALQELSADLQKASQLKIVTRKGETTSPKMLEKVSVDTAANIIVLSSCENFSTEEEKDNSDTNVIKICYALSIAINKGVPIKVIPEIYINSNKEIVKTILQDRVLQIDSNVFLSKLLVQTSLFNGLVGVYQDLFSFEGSEIYLTQNKFGEIPFGEISMRLTDGIAIGFICPKNGLKINPSPKELVGKDHRLVFIMTDTTNYTPQAKALCVPKALPISYKKHTPSLKSILVIGWNSETVNIISEYDKYIADASNFRLIMTENTAPPEHVLDTLKSKIKSTIEISKVAIIDETYLSSVKVSTFDLLVVLTASNTSIQTRAIDSANIRLLLLLRKILADASKRPLIVAEVFDTSNLELFDQLGLSDFLLSNRLISIFLTQLAKQPDLIDVYEKLLSTDGAEIYIKSVSTYLEAASGDYTFADLIALGQQCNEIIIGYKLMLKEPLENGCNYQVFLNPSKTDVVRLTQEDALIVISSEDLCVVK